MSMFELLGHDNPRGSYPGPTLAVGRLNGQLIAVYYDENGEAVPDGISRDAKFIRFDARQRRELGAFDWQSDRLYAHSETEVVRYKIKDEQAFFSEVANNSRAVVTAPGVRSMSPRNLRA